MDFVNQKFGLIIKLMGKQKLLLQNMNLNFAAKPNFKIILKSICWILKNFYYLRNKHIQVNKNRKISTESLIKMNIMLKQ